MGEHYLAFDSETQIHKSNKRTSNPFDPRNYVVMRGWKRFDDTRAHKSYFTGQTPDNYLRIPDDITVLYGFNIKFDLLYEMVNNNPDLKAFYKRGGRVWCGQYAEYLLQGMQKKYQMCSMDQIIESYGGRKKIDGMKELWKAGVQTSDIDPAMVEDYLIGTEEEGRNSGDIGNTELICLGQIELAKSMGMYDMILARMDGLCATTEMEYNGIKIDTARAIADCKLLNDELVVAKAALSEYVASIPDEVGFSWGSRIHTSCIIFGGTIKYKKQSTFTDPKTGELARLKAVADWPLFNKVPVDPAECSVSGALNGVDRYAQGQVEQDVFLGGKRKGEPKFKKVSVQGELKTRFTDFFYKLDGYTEGRKEWETAQLDGEGEPCYSTDKDTMAIITKRDIPFLKALGNFQSLNKEIGTYYIRDDGKKGLVGMLTCINPADNIVHHMLNHVNTVTSRLAASNPNMQNIPRGDKSSVKAMFVSRFEDGYVGELDYSQLEVVVQGWLSGDKNLVADLCAGIDFHCKRVSAKCSVSYEFALFHCKTEEAPDHDKWKKVRTGVKQFSFQRAYGAGAAAIADSTGLPVAEIKEMIIAEDKLYPDVVTFNTKVATEVERTAEYFRDPAMGYRTFRRGTWQSPTGTMYTWRSWDAPKFMRDKGIADTFSPPELKNYPVQGTGGEVVQMVLGVLWRWFVSTDNMQGRALLVNTVHDCVWVDMHPDVVDVVMPVMKKIMESIPQLLKIKFNVDCPVPFPVDSEIGRNMLNLSHYPLS